MMEKKYYLSGLRPIIREIYSDYEVYYSFQWNDATFKQDMSYMHEIYYDPSGDIQELTEKEFEAYVEKLKKDKGIK